MRDFPENAQHAVLGMIDDLDDTAAMANAVFFIGLFNSQQYAVADTGGFCRACLARQMNADFRCCAMRFLVPFVRCGNEIAVAVARSDVGKHCGGQGACMVQLLAPLFD